MDTNCVSEKFNLFINNFVDTKFYNSIQYIDKYYFIKKL